MVTDQEFQHIVELRDRLRAKGYKASIANVTCFDIYQNGWVHDLSLDEATSLDEMNIQHPVDLHNYRTSDGWVSRYQFPEP